MDTQGFAFLATPRHPAPGTTSASWCAELEKRLPDARLISVTWVETRYQNATAVSTRELSRYDLLGPASSCGS